MWGRRPQAAAPLLWSGDGVNAGGVGRGNTQGQPGEVLGGRDPPHQSKSIFSEPGQTFGERTLVSATHLTSCFATQEAASGSARSRGARAARRCKARMATLGAPHSSPETKALSASATTAASCGAPCNFRDSSRERCAARTCAVCALPAAAGAPSVLAKKELRCATIASAAPATLRPLLLDMLFTAEHSLERRHHN